MGLIGTVIGQAGCHYFSRSTQVCELSLMDPEEGGCFLSADSLISPVHVYMVIHEPVYFVADSPRESISVVG